MSAHPAIVRNGYQLCAVSQFLDRADNRQIARYRLNGIGKGVFIIWDPNDDEDGFMLCLPTVAQLNAEFIAHFGEYLAEA